MTGTWVGSTPPFGADADDACAAAGFISFARCCPPLLSSKSRSNFLLFAGKNSLSSSRARCSKTPPPFCVLEDVAVTFPEMCSKERRDVCRRFVACVYRRRRKKRLCCVLFCLSKTFCRRPFDERGHRNNNRVSIARRGERDDGECFCADKKDGGPVGGGGIPREKKVDKTGSKKKDLKKDPKSYSKSSFNKGKREKKTVKRKKERGQRTKTEEVE